MPSRWWVPLDVDPATIKLEHVHAALSAWFDESAGAHAANTKAYALSPLGESSSGVGVEVSVLSDQALNSLHRASRSGRTVRLGRQVARLAAPRLLAEQAWEVLDQPSGRRSWELDFLTPTTFRRGNRTSPLPVAATALRGLQDTWNAFSGRAERSLNAQQSDRVWVSRIEGRTETLELSGVTVRGFVGSVTYRADEQDLADLVDPLFRMAAYSGVGSFKGKGLGVVRSLPAAASRRGPR